MRLYETTLVIDSLLKADDIERIIRNFKEFISNNGGEVVRVEEWGKRRLAYEIEKKQYGYYVYFRFQAPPNLPKLLEREFRLNDNILRYLTVLVDPKLLLKEERQREGKPQVVRRQPARPEAEKVAPATTPEPAAEVPATEEPAEAASPPAEASSEASTEATPEPEGSGEAESSDVEEPTPEETKDKEMLES